MHLYTIQKGRVLVARRRLGRGLDHELFPVAGALILGGIRVSRALWAARGRCGLPLSAEVEAARGRCGLNHSLLVQGKIAGGG